MRTTLTLLFATIFLFACKTDKKEIKNTKKEQVIENTNSFAQSIEKAHKKATFLNYEAIQFDTKISFGGNTILDATISVATNSAYAKIELENGEKIFVNENKTYVSPGLKENKATRFNAYTWTYFFLLPYKLSDDGVILNDYTTKHDSKNFITQKMTFKANTGDAPEDWYVLYANKENNILEEAAYIVTLGKTQKEAEKDPHAIKYENFTSINNIPFATKWTFWGWNEDEGLTQQIGEASINNIKFIPNFKQSILDVPADFIKQ